MNSHVLSGTHLLCASSPGSRSGGALEKTEVRGSTLVLTSLNPHPTLSLEKGEANIALTT